MKDSMAPFNPDPYEDRIRCLDEERRRALTALELAGSMGTFASALNHLESPDPILYETIRKVRALIRFKTAAIYLVNEQDADFYLAACSPSDGRQYIENEVDALIATFMFSWSLGRSKPLIVPDSAQRETLLIHSLTTPSRVRGMFVGVLDESKTSILDSYLSLLTVILTGAAQALESYELYGRIAEMNRRLERQVEDRSRELSETSSRLARERIRSEAADRALEEKSDTIRAFFETSQDGMVIIDRRGVVLEINNRAASMFDHEMKEVLGQPLRDLLSDDFFEERKDRYLGIMRRGEPVRTEESLMGRRFELSLSPLKDGRGEVVRVACLIRDVTEDRELSDALTTARDEARAASKAKTEFLANMSHELRTPINGIMGMTQLLLAAELQEDQQECCRDIMFSAGRVLRIVNDLLDLSSLENGRMALNEVSFSTRRVFDFICKTFAEEARRKGLEFHCEFAPDLAEDLVGDPDRLRQLLINIVHNAVTFTRTGRVDVWVGEAPELLDAPCPESCAAFAFTVSDTGPGIPEQHRQTIFDSFTLAEEFITKRSGGSGLGLAISRQLAERMNGVITVESEEGRGSVFKVAVPLPRSTPEVGAKLASVHAPCTPQCGRVLTVEKGASNNGSPARLLRGSGLAVEKATDCSDALKRIGDGGCELVVLSVPLIGGGGLELTRTIRGGAINGVDRNLPVLMLAEDVSEDEMRRCLNAGVNAVISGPLDAEAFVRTVQGMIPPRR
ncbi:hypothetical protein DQK91_14300 [Oceanidesulfovibrio marinus]|uniref:histidine kinase n=2 Tax=Oceanidesulfovibrio marinus TaxID=370038 RepID=A0A6P1ZE85_9BACT|nr:hypothetical protein DQK91_14300 [Oceanidesulfovibrio marinus]